MSRIVDIEPLLKKYDGMNEGTEFSPIHFINDLMALEQQPTHGSTYGGVSWGGTYKEEAQPSEDCISRQKALACFEQTNTRQGAKYAIETLPSVTPRTNLAETSQDCISREAVLNGLANIAKAKAKSDAQKALMGRVMFFTEQLPSVTPERPKGKWMVYAKVEFGDFKGTEKYKCSECGHEVGVFLSRYCPNCGAEMGGEEDG